MYATTKLLDAIQKGNVQDVKLLLANSHPLPVTDKECATILHDAVSANTYLGNKDAILREVLRQAVNLDMLARNEWGETALHIATSTPPCVMEFLIQHLLMTNTEHKLPAYLDCKDSHGDTAFFCACWARNVQVVKLLLRSNASSISKNLRGDTALHEIAVSMHETDNRLRFSAGDVIF